MLLHGFYLGGVFWAVKHGLPAGIAALIAGLQPLATGLLVGPFLGERVTPRRWLGIGTGFLGALLVVAPKLGAVDGFPPLPVAICTLGMLSITLGTIWQKRTAASVDLRTNAVAQYVGAAGVTLPLALLTETGRLDFSAGPLARPRLGGVRPLDRRHRAASVPHPPRRRRGRRGPALPRAAGLRADGLSALRRDAFAGADRRHGRRRRRRRPRQPRASRKTKRDQHSAARGVYAAPHQAGALDEPPFPPRPHRPISSCSPQTAAKDSRRFSRRHAGGAAKVVGGPAHLRRAARARAACRPRPRLARDLCRGAARARRLCASG